VKRRGRQLVKPECPHKCVFVKITDQLFLCPHSSYGWATNLLGAEDEGRRLMAASGGYATMLTRQQAARKTKDPTRLL